MQVYSNIIGILKDAGAEYQVSEHGAVRTSAQAAKVRGAELKTGVKAMVLKSLEGRFMLVLLPADQRVDFKKVAELEGTTRVALAAEEEVFKVTGCRLGGVPPFGHKTKLKTYMSKDVLSNEWINFNAGLRTRSVRMKSDDLRKIINPIMF